MNKEATNIQTKTIDSWSNFEDHINENFLNKDRNTKKWIFRGQRNYLQGTLELDISKAVQDKPKPELRTSLERLCDSLEIPLIKGDLLENGHIIEKNIITEFKRRFHQYSNYVPDRNDNIEWLSIMRHHGAPTRLLDWNFSPYIALYFALHKSNKENGYAIWCIESEWARKESIEKFLKVKGCTEDDFKKSSYGLNPDLLTKLLLKNLSNKKPQILFHKTVFPISPKLINRRLTVQKGLFMCPGDPTCTFEDNLKEMANYEKNIEKIIIPEKLRIEFLAKLHNMNITHATLFPDLDGFAFSLSVYHQSYTMNFNDSNHKDDDSAWG